MPFCAGMHRKKILTVSQSFEIRMQIRDFE
jgi:hypothetical protein